MTSEDTDGVTIIAEPFARQHVLVLFLLCWLFGSVVVVVLVADNAGGTNVWVAAGVILVATLITGWFRSWRVGVRIDGSGVTIRNFFRTHQIGWREVDRFADGSVLSGGRGNDPFMIRWALRVVRRDERQVTVGGPGRSPGRRGRRRTVTARGTMPGEPERGTIFAAKFAGTPEVELAPPKTLTAIRRVAERYGIPAELTGVPPLRDGFWTRLRERRGP